MADAYTGLDLSGFTVIADIAVDGIAAGENLAARFKLVSPGVWQGKLPKPIAGLNSKLIVSVKDRQGNINRMERQFSTRQ